MKLDLKECQLCLYGLTDEQIENAKRIFGKVLPIKNWSYPCNTNVFISTFENDHISNFRKDVDLTEISYEQLLEHDKEDVEVEENNPINPNHYKQYSLEAIDMMIKIYGVEKVKIFCELNAFKYRMRLGLKDDFNQDLQKEQYYLNKIKELENGK